MWSQHRLFGMVLQSSGFILLFTRATTSHCSHETTRHFLPFATGQQLVIVAVQHCTRKPDGAHRILEFALSTMGHINRNVVKQSFEKKGPTKKPMVSPTNTP